MNGFKDWQRRQAEKKDPKLDASKPREYDARTVTVKFHGQAVDFDTFVGEFAPDVDEDEEPDMINSPPHYTTGDIESIDYIEDQGHGRGFCYGNALKYLARAPHKGCERADLLKAIWYVERLLDGQLDGDQVDGG